MEVLCKMVDVRLNLSDDERNSLYNALLHPDYDSAERLEAFLKSMDTDSIEYLDDDIICISDNNLINTEYSSEYNCDDECLSANYEAEFLLAA